MKYDEPRGDWFSLPKPWLELPQAMRDSVVQAAGEIRTYDGGHLVHVDGLWEVMKSGTQNDADIILNALRKAN
ncbi:hypothetical protein EN904_10585 [Mesorhizobium sp. M7A.F.Ca.CA.001.07.2.1]|uniref:hypothetical protein n=1 Tax=Mesorhizobium TaxID=68287 RepID=UPI000FCABE63|nr:MULTISPECIES: hypothetical protein [Mesorhizobium]RVB48718.1 hypothetical protein EN918_01350 [Mesorhizobium sp. M7A.F.Ca.CA.004.05.1.1]MCF6126079.1 hypothetical protein [Mesorhizobium ciceri]MCQ8813886.1 hypothetical protein [Mesorhizobium sp. SEMIA396]RUX79327.1 hypothetical protein EN983_12565 [Mesorhizobium sp. M7A.F.Ca.CA.004.08.2.1]RUX89413.1 hypothetical protein EN982_02410 [Mesorhizobium sp. M7A.F.Ca.CA.004.08.1.1]